MIVLKPGDCQFELIKGKDSQSILTYLLEQSQRWLALLVTGI
jgi:hypothetical protein